MKKILLGGVFAVFAFALSVNFAFAAITPVTPSTNDINIGNGWSNFDVLSVGIGTADIQFQNPRGFVACFEYRTDGNLGQSTGNNYNPGVTDGLYPFICVGGKPVPDTTPKTKTITADEYIEIRMVFGGETDERFDWTRVEVLEAPFVRSAVITSPSDGEEVSGTVSFDATLTDEDGDDSVQWAVRKGTCAAATGTVLGNVDGFSSSFTWDHKDFHASADTSSWIPGGYCFVFNPSESTGDAAIRETREFSIADTKAPLVTIESPEDGDVVSGIVHIFGTIVEDVAMGNYNLAIYPGDADFMDFSKRLEQDNVNPATIFDNEDIYQWDTTGYDDGEYLIRLAARDEAGNRDLSGDPELGGDDSQHVIKVTVNNTPDNKDDCKKDGWSEWLNPVFKNQGDCVSWLQANENATGNRKDN